MVNIASISIELAAFFFRVFEQCTKSPQNIHNFYHFDVAYPEDSYYMVQKLHNSTYVSRCCLSYQNVSSFLVTTGFSSIYFNVFQTLLRGNFDNTAKFCSFNSPGTRLGPSYRIFQIIGDTYTDLSSCRYYFVIAPIPGLYNKSERFSIWISPVSAGSGSSASSSIFSGVLQS